MTLFSMVVHNLRGQRVEKFRDEMFLAISCKVKFHLIENSKDTRLNINIEIKEKETISNLAIVAF